MTSFERFKTLEQSKTDAVAVGDGLVAVCSDSQVTLVSETDQTVFDHGSPVSDVTVSDRILVLSGGVLTAYDRDGTPIWDRSVDSAHGVTTLPSSGVVGVLESAAIRTVDPDSGREQTTLTREPPGRPDDDQFIGTGQGFVTSTWSLLQCLDQSGDQLFERNLDTAIRDIGCVDETLVTALKNGHLKGFELASGEQKWQTELAVQQMSSRGEGKLLLSTNSGVKSVTPDGSIDSVQGITNGRVYTDANSSLVCTEHRGTIAIHVPTGELVSIETVTESVGVGGTVDLEITNLADAGQELSIQAELDHADLSPAERHVSLRSQESSLIDFPVGGIRTDGEAVFTAVIEDRVVAQEPIEITDAAESTLAAEAEVTPVRIEDGAVALELAVENTGSSSFDAVRAIETDEETTHLGPEETWTTTLSKTYEPGRTVTVGVEITRGNRRTQLAPTCALPEDPSVDLEQKSGALHATLTAADRVTWADELVIEAPGADRVRTPVEITDGSLRVIIPAYESGLARVGLSKMGIAEQERLSDNSPLSALNSRTDRSGDRQSYTGRQDSDGQDSTDSTLTARTTQTIDAEAESAESSSNTQPSRTAETDTDAADTSDRSPGEAVVFDREVSSKSPPVGNAVTDRVRLRNRGRKAVEPTVRLAQESFDLGRLPPDETRSIERSVAVYAADTTVAVPSATLHVNGSVVDKLPSEEITPAERGVLVRGSVAQDSGTCNITVENNTTASRRVTEVEVHGHQLLDAPVTLDGGQTADFTGTVRGVDGGPAQCRIGFADTESITGLLSVQAEQATEDGGDSAPFDSAIGVDTEVAGEYGTVVLEFRNDSGAPLSDVTLTAEGDSINDMLYSPAVRESLDPGDRIEHFVDLKTSAGEVSIELTANCTLNGDTRSLRYQATGPAVSTESEWTDDHRKAWTLEPVTDDDQQVDLPAELTTPYERQEANDAESRGLGDVDR